MSPERFRFRVRGMPNMQMTLRYSGMYYPEGANSHGITKEGRDEEKEIHFYVE